MCFGSRLRRRCPVPSDQFNKLILQQVSCNDCKDLGNARSGQTFREHRYDRCIDSPSPGPLGPRASEIRLIKNANMEKHAKAARTIGTLAMATATSVRSFMASTL